jgi:hypothetical protein
MSMLCLKWRQPGAEHTRSALADASHSMRTTSPCMITKLSSKLHNNYAKDSAAVICLVAAVRDAGGNHEGALSAGSIQ